MIGRRQGQASHPQVEKASEILGYCIARIRLSILRALFYDPRPTKLRRDLTLVPRVCSGSILGEQVVHEVGP